MTWNIDKCHLLASEYKHELMFASISDEKIWEENSVKLLRILIDSDPTFNNHIKMICKNASQKLTALSRFSHILSERKENNDIKGIFRISIQLLPTNLDVLQ